MTIHPQDLRLLIDVLHRECGLWLSAEQEYLLRARLLPVADRHGVSDIAGVAREIRMGSSHILRDVIEAMSTHETSFFRDMAPFRDLQEKILPCLMRARAADRTLRLWSAGCASGQEPYSLAMLLQDMGLTAAGWKYHIDATDISLSVLERARQGVYSSFDVQRGVPTPALLRHFDGADGQWTLKPAIREVVQFRQLNLLDGTAAMGMFDVIFCRNVLIYFDPSTREKVLAALRGNMKRDAVLFLGAAEAPPPPAARLQPYGGVAGAYQRDDAMRE
ncbi:MAG TPA: protein-glutamate O-methyltransferase CheR [Patescibacteria group bacterium]|nr:protein-glutamate O-methyltransferase CheR [Patescibacteria group bacterium]